jgi:hypothetical protein
VSWHTKTGKALVLGIRPAERDPRLITVRRGGILLDADRHLLALGRPAAQNMRSTTSSTLDPTMIDRAERSTRRARGFKARSR